MNGITDYFDRIKPVASPEEMADKIIAARKKKTAKKRGFRPLAAAAAVFITLAAGVTGAAAAGLLDLCVIFGGAVRSDDDKLAEELLSCAQNIKWYTSDDDYEIVVKGVTGSAYDMMVSYEIVRTDGSPVKEHFINIPEDGVLYTIYNIDHIWDTRREERSNGSYIGSGGEKHIRLNDEGNIEIFERYISDADITGRHNVNAGYNFYPKTQFNRWCYDSGMHADYDENGAHIYYTEKSEDGLTDIRVYSEMSAADESIIGLALDWRLEFDYFPTEAALKSRSITNTGDTLQLRHYYGNALSLREYTMTKGVFTSVSGQLTISRPYTSGEAFSIANEYSDCFLITSDGRHIDVALSRIAEYPALPGETDVFLVDVRYSAEEYSEITLIDIDTITAISINGAVFNLE